MPGMNSGLNVDDPTVVAAFRSALLHQAIIALAIFAVLSVVWVSVRERHDAARRGRGEGRAAAARRARRAAAAPYQFRHLWVFDGLLEAQTAMRSG